MFFTWSSWLRATTLNTMRRNCSSTHVRRQPERADHQRMPARRSCARLVEVEVRERAERLHVQLVAVGKPVEPARHEMPAAALLEQPALGHLDPRRPRHRASRRTRSRRIPADPRAPCRVAAHAVELQQPVLEARRQRRPAPSAPRPCAAFQAMTAFARAPPAEADAEDVAERLLASASASEAPSPSRSAALPKRARPAHRPMRAPGADCGPRAAGTPGAEPPRPV